MDCVDLPSDQFICAIGNNLYHLIIIAVSLPTVVALSACLTHHCSTHEFCGESSTGAGCYCRAGFASKYHSSNTLGTDKKRYIQYINVLVIDLKLFLCFVLMSPN